MIFFRSFVFFPTNFDPFVRSILNRPIERIKEINGRGRILLNILVWWLINIAKTKTID